MLLAILIFALGSGVPGPACPTPPCPEPVYEAVLSALHAQRTPRPLVIGTRRILREFEQPPSPENSNLGQMDSVWMARLQAQGLVSDSASAPKATRISVSFGQVQWEGESNAKVEVSLYEQAKDGSAAFISIMLYSLQRSPSGTWTVIGREPRHSLYVIPDG